MENLNDHIDQLRYAQRHLRADREAEITAFEQWQHAPDPDDIRVRQKIANLRVNDAIDEIIKFY